mgnify:CR=1 FL=1
MSKVKISALPDTQEIKASSGSITVTGAFVGNLTGNASGTAATVTTAAQPAITSLGTLTALQVDNLNVNGNTISATSGAINITPEAGSAIVLDGTINIDAGVVTGATSIASTGFNKVAITAPATSATLTIAEGKTLTSSNTLTFTGTDSSSIDFGAGGTAAFIGTAQTFIKAQGVATVAVTSTTNSIATDASLGNDFSHTLTENTTLANPTNMVTGRYYTWTIVQDATPRTLAFGNAFKWPGGTAMVVSTANGAIDTITARYNGTVLLAVYAQAYA